jgi:hypothetical protein
MQFILAFGLSVFNSQTAGRSPHLYIQRPLGSDCVKSTAFRAHYSDIIPAIVY